MIAAVGAMVQDAVCLGLSMDESAKAEVRILPKPFQPSLRDSIIFSSPTQDWLREKRLRTKGTGFSRAVKIRFQGRLKPLRYAFRPYRQINSVRGYFATDDWKVVPQELKCVREN
jgi:hypothetical protein